MPGYRHQVALLVTPQPGDREEALNGIVLLHATRSIEMSRQIFVDDYFTRETGS